MMEDLHKTFPFELYNRLANRNTADAMLGGKGILTELLAFFDIASQYPLAKPFDKRIGDGLPFDQVFTLVHDLVCIIRHGGWKLA
jgi:hypothetical protein